MPQFPVHSTVMSAGQTMSGGVVSTTVTSRSSAFGGQAARSVASRRQVTVWSSRKKPLGVAVLAPDRATPGQTQL